MPLPTVPIATSTTTEQPPRFDHAKLRRLRRERGWSVDQAVAHTGLSSSMWAALEIGRVHPSVRTIGRLALTLGVPAGTLFTDATDGR